MSHSRFLSRSMLWIPLGFLGIYLLTIFSRPLLPIDETRYVSVAWEMFLRHDWLAPLTKNGEPYHHKPPLLFWMINAVWFFTGPSRWAATIPPVAMGLASVYLTVMLTQRLFTGTASLAARVPYILMGCLPFLVYSSMVMFDVTMSVFVLLTLLGTLSFAQTQKFLYVVLMALTMGLGVLTKGPVAYLYVIFPMLLGPLWYGAAVRPVRWYGGCLMALLLSTVPVLLWLIPVLQQSDNHFAFWLVWEQTAGRITGNFNDAHVRPFYFYMPIVLILAMPWVFFPQLWRQGRALRAILRAQEGLRFVLCWVVPTFISFCLISGKQPHYLVPLVPGMAILITCLLQELNLKTLQKVALGAYIVFIAAHVVGAQTFFRNYDLMPVAAYMQKHPERDWAFVRKYHGEVTFLARRERPLDVVEPEEVDAWFDQHPDGYALIRFNNPETLQHLIMVMEMPYRGKRLGVFRKPPVTAP